MLDNLKAEIAEAINGEDEIAKELAIAIKEINEDCEAGEYDAEIRDELLDDAHEVAQSSELAEDLDTKVKLEKLYNVIKAIAGAV